MRLERQPRDDDRKEVEKRRKLLLGQFEILERVYRRAVRNSGAAAGELQEYGFEPYDFEGLDDEVMENLNDDQTPSVDDQGQEDTEEDITVTIAPERRPLLLPSTSLPKHHPLSKREFNLRKDQAKRYIMAIREIIAEKSFHYIHIIRGAPRKSVMTRARNTILKLNYKIASYSRMYGRCRAALHRLAADPGAIAMFKKLTRQDVKASSAVLNPNEPGSTSLSLSWIWQISGNGDQSTASLSECKKIQITSDIK